MLWVYGGEREIRTLDTLTSILVFETSAFNHSATSPLPRGLFEKTAMLKDSKAVPPAIVRTSLLAVFHWFLEQLPRAIKTLKSADLLDK